MSELKISGCLKLIKIKDLWLLFAYQVIITDHYNTRAVLIIKDLRSLQERRAKWL